MAHQHLNLKRLPRIQSPADLRKLAPEELKEVAREMRETIIDTVMRKGGHLGASLGIIELTIAIHYIYNTPRDKFLLDVGHQGYGHKLLTGRFDRFDTIRQEGGLSGFLKRSESEYDAFGAGHASTAISAALGQAIARDHLGDDYKVVALIGDGAMTGGLAFEGLNNAGLRRETDFVVILNDNSMSISPNTGALAEFFSRVVTTPFYNERKDDIREFVKSLPKGEALTRAIRKMEGSLKHLIVPNKFFEELGFRYIGPVDGHDLDVIVPLLQRVRELDGPILLHCKTVKGKGLAEAEADQVWGHAPTIKVPVAAKVEAKVEPQAEPKAEVAPPKPKPKSYTQVFADAMIALAERDERVVAITAAMSTGTGVDEFQKKFPERTFDVGIAEAHAVCCAAGMAAGGLRPVCAIYSTFLQRAYDQIVHDCAIQHLPVIFALDRGGLVGADGPTHHGALDLSYLRCIQGMVVMAPKDEGELRHMMATALAYEAGPIAVRYPRGSGVGADLTEPFKTLEIGKAEVLREGADTCILAIGAMVQPALKAAELLAEKGIDAGVVNARFVKPLDVALLDELAAKHDLLVSVEDNVIQGGFGSAVNEALAMRGHYTTACVPLGLPDRFIEHGAQESLYKQLGLDAEGIAKSVYDLLRGARPQKP
jgi:1-deoxy-D-xylulose-5-phosphate synthase